MATAHTSFQIFFFFRPFLNQHAAFASACYINTRILQKLAKAALLNSADQSPNRTGFFGWF